jgi:hypothetical protein
MIYHNKLKFKVAFRNLRKISYEKDIIYSSTGLQFPFKRNNTIKYHKIYKCIDGSYMAF